MRAPLVIGTIGIVILLAMFGGCAVADLDMCKTAAAMCDKPAAKQKQHARRHVRRTTSAAERRAEPMPTPERPSPVIPTPRDEVVPTGGPEVRPTDGPPDGVAR